MLLGCCIAATPAAAPAAATYPENPFHDGESIYLSHQGVYRFDPDEPEALWKSLDGIETYAPVVHGDRLLVGSTRGLYALDKANGDIVWHIETAHTLFSPTLSGNAYAGSVHGELYAIYPVDGRIIWRHSFPGWIYSPAIGDTTKILWTGGQQHRIYALAARDGTVVHEIETTQESVFGPVDIGNDRVAFNLFDGSTLVVRASSGDVEGVLAGDAQPDGLARRGDTVYRTQRDGRLAAFAADDLRPLWQQALTTQALILHPSRSAALLLSDGERDLILFDPTVPDRPCRVRNPYPALLPLQVSAETIIFFRRQMQPRHLSLVHKTASCE